MSNFIKIIMIVLFVVELAAVGYILHYKGWESGYQEGWRHAQSTHTGC